jgi:hypothetical protein
MITLLLPSVPDDQSRILSQIQAACDYMPEDEEASQRLVPWLEWQLEEMLDKVSLDDIQPIELVALVGIVGPIFARTLTPDPAQRRPLRAV